MLFYFLCAAVGMLTVVGTLPVKDSDRTKVSLWPVRTGACAVVRKEFQRAHVGEV